MVDALTVVSGLVSLLDEEASDILRVTLCSTAELEIYRQDSFRRFAMIGAIGLRA